MIKPAIAQAFNATPSKTVDEIEALAKSDPADATALVKNLGNLYAQGQNAYAWSDAYQTDAKAILDQGLQQTTAYAGRPAFQVYETRDVSLGQNTKATYVPGRIYQRDGTMFMKLDGGREVSLSSSERMPHDVRGELRKDLIGGFVSQQGDSSRVRVKGTVGNDGRFKVEFAAPDRPGFETFEQGRLHWNPKQNWLELQTPRGNVVITNEMLKADLEALVKLSDRPSIGVVLPGEAKPGPNGGLVYDGYPKEYGALTGFSRKAPNASAGPTPETKLTYANFGFSALAGVPVVFPSEQRGRIERNTERRGDGMFGPDAVNGRFWAFGRFTRGESGQLGFEAKEVTEQCDRWGLSPGDHAPDADNAEALKLLAEAHEYDGASGPVLSSREDGW